MNWCPALGTVLANEEVIDGKSERGDHPVVRMPMKQWMLRITAYADRWAGATALRTLHGSCAWCMVHGCAWCMEAALSEAAGWSLAHSQGCGVCSFFKVEGERLGRQHPPCAREIVRLHTPACVAACMRSGRWGPV